MNDAPADTDDLKELVAASMDAPTELLPHLPAVLRDLEDLGARSTDVVATLEGQGLAPGHRVLDLGCGKGATAIALSEHFGVHVDGVDAMPAFVAHATARADAHGVGERCHFSVGDVREAVAVASDYDVVLLLALGPVFGDLVDTVGLLRRCVKPGGLVLVDEAYLRDGTLPPDEVADCFDRETTVQRLESHGDRLVGERVIDTPEAEAWCRSMTAEILKRAHEVAHEAPDLASSVIEFAERQQRETARLDGPLVGALFLLQVRRQ